MKSIYLIALLLLLGMSGTAHADPVSAFILGALLIPMTPTTLAITTALLYAAGAAALSVLSAALTPKQKAQDVTSLPGGTVGKLQSGGTVPRSFIVGRGATAGSLVYANTYSAAMAASVASGLGLTPRVTGNTPNAFLVQVIALSDLPVNGLVSLFVNGVAATLGGTEKFEGFAVPEYNEGGYEFMWVRFYDGTQTVADPALVGLFASDTDRPYDSNRIGAGVPYAIVTTIYGSTLISGYPQLKFVLDGVSFYDRRYDTTAGGSGAQRWATPSTWALSANPIVIGENILRGISYAGQWVYGAQTVSAAQLPSAAWMAAASECDTAITLLDTTTEPQFAVGGEIRFDVQPADTLDELFKACNGKLAEIGGVYKPRAGGAGTSVFSLTDSDILSTEKQTFDPFPSLGEIVNAVTAKYISPAEGYVAKDAPALYDAALETEDGGRRQPVDVNYGFVNSGTQVQRLMKAALADARAMRRHYLPMPPDAFVLEPNDVVSWTSTRNGYTAKLFEVVKADDLPNLNMGLALKEIDPAAYDWTPATDEQPITDGTLVIVRPAAQAIVNWNAVPWTILSDDDRELPGIKLSWDSNTVDVDGVRFEIRITATAEVILRGETDSIASGSLVVGQNLISNTAYQARGQYRPISVRDVTWSSWVNVTTPDVRIQISDLDDLIATTLEYGETAFRDLLDPVALTLLDRRIGDAAILALLTGQENKSTINNHTIQIRADTNVLVDNEAEIRVQAVNAILLQINDPTTGLSTRASSSDVVTLQTLTGHASYGNVALGSRATTLEATVNNGSTGVSATYSNLVTLTAAVNHVSTGLATRASASSVTTLSAQMDDVSADGTFRTIASAGAGGALALVDLQVSASLGATFANAGIQIAAFVDASSTPYSRVRLYADRTEISIPGVTGGSPFAPFGVQTVNGNLQVSLVPAAIPDSAIIPRMMFAGTAGGNITTLTASDVTKSVDAWYNSGNGDIVISSDIVVAQGSALWIDFDAVINSDNPTVYDADGWFRIVVNGTTLQEMLVYTQTATGGFKNFPISFRKLASGLSAGPLTVQVLFYRGTDAHTYTITLKAPQLILTELQNPNVVTGTASAPTPAISFCAATVGGTSGSFTAASIGTAGAYRVVAVVLGWWSSIGSTPSLTIGGNAATRKDVRGTGTGENQALYYLRVPTGTTANIVASGLPADAQGITIQVWAVTAANAEPRFYNNIETTAGSTLCQYNAVSGDVMLCAVYGDNNVSSYAGSWGGSNSPTERADALTGATNNARYASYDMALTQTISEYFTVTGSGGTPYFGVMLAAWH